MQLKSYKSHAWLDILKVQSILKINLFCFHLRHFVNFFVCFVDLLAKAYDVPTLIRKIVNHLQCHSGQKAQGLCSAIMCNWLLF